MHEDLMNRAANSAHVESYLHADPRAVQLRIWARAASRRRYQRIRDTGMRAVAPRVSAALLADLEVLARETCRGELYERLMAAYGDNLMASLVAGETIEVDSAHGAGAHSALRYVSPKTFEMFALLRAQGMTNAGILARLIALQRADVASMSKLQKVEIGISPDTNVLIAAAASKAGVGIDELVRALLSGAASE
jgi:hypothetical protein